MKTVYVAYPAAFASQSKFERKVQTLIARLGAVRFCIKDAPNGLAATFAQARGFAVHSVLDTPAPHNCDHFIVFDDGPRFGELVAALKSAGASYRRIPQYKKTCFALPSPIKNF